MKKLLFVLLVVVIISLVGQKIGFLNYIQNYSKPDQINKDSAMVQITKTPNRPIIGIHYRIIDRQTAIQNELVEGAYITQIIDGSPAEKSNLQEEDIITEVDNRNISGLDEESIYNLISTLNPGSKINLKVWRNRKIIDIQINLN